jgi:hypothetical protein
MIGATLGFVHRILSDAGESSTLDIVAVEQFVRARPA